MVIVNRREKNKEKKSMKNRYLTQNNILCSITYMLILIVAVYNTKNSFDHTCAFFKIQKEKYVCRT